MSADLRAGWGWPGNSRKAHYFKDGSITSLCGRWLYSGEREQGDFVSKDDCTPCTKLLAKEKEA